MSIFTRSCLAVSVVGAALVAVPAVHAQAIIDNGTVQLGVAQLGDLNVPVPDCSIRTIPEGSCGVGLRSLTTGDESTFDGCPCEG